MPAPARHLAAYAQPKHKTECKGKDKESAEPLSTEQWPDDGEYHVRAARACVVRAANAHRGTRQSGMAPHQVKNIERYGMPLVATPADFGKVFR